MHDPENMKRNIVIKEGIVRSLTLQVAKKNFKLVFLAHCLG